MRSCAPPIWVQAPINAGQRPTAARTAHRTGRGRRSAADLLLSDGYGHWRLAARIIWSSFGQQRPVVTYRFGPFSVKDNESLWINDKLVPLSPLQLRLLSFLCSHPQQVLDKERIVENVWGRSDVSDVSLARAIHGLRHRLSTGSRASELIRNIYGRGYMLTLPVTVSDDSGFPAPTTLNVEGATASPVSLAPPRADQERPVAVVATLRSPRLKAVR